MIGNVNFKTDEVTSGFYPKVYKEGTTTLVPGQVDNPLPIPGGISTAQQLQDMNNDLVKDYILLNDIDCSSIANFIPIGTAAANFNGKLNGNGFSISNLTINHPSMNYVGLFGYTGTSALMYDYGISSGNITGKGLVGSMVGFNNGFFHNCYANATVNGTETISQPENGTGNFCGQNNGLGKIHFCYANGNTVSA